MHKCFGAGLAGGSLGGLAGLGGGVIMVPLMTQFARLTQHQAVGTSSAAVLVTGISGCASFGSSGAVDFASAAAIATTAVFGARFGVRLTTRFDGVQLARIFAVFQLAVAPLVPLKGSLVRKSREADDGEKDGQHKASRGICAAELCKLAIVGVAAGVASGMFGIGGGLVVRLL